MSVRVTLINGLARSAPRDLLGALSAAAQDAARRETIDWIKRLRLVDYEGRSMRERFTYRGDSLWWFTELYLQKMRRLNRAVAVILALEALCDAESPSALELSGADDVTREAARAFAGARRLAIACDAEPLTAAPAAVHDSRWFGATTIASRLRMSGALRRVRHPQAAAFVHTAFWQPEADGGAGQEGYIGPVLDAIAARLPAGELALVGVGPRRNFRARRWWDPLAPAGAGSLAITPIERFAPIGAVRGSLGVWRARHAHARAIVSGASVREAALFRGCDLWPILRVELEDAARVQWPWSARAMDEAGAAMDALAPQVMVTYAEAGGWGRALVLESRRRGIRSIGVQHGFIYRHWLNYLHEPDEMLPLRADAGFPRPDRTLLFDRFAAEHLERAGRFPADSLEITGSARLDALTASVQSLTEHDHAATRVITGAFPHQRLGLLAAKFTEIQHLLPAFVRAVASQPDIHVAIKAHPAETAEVYTPYIGATMNVTVVPGDVSLSRLLAVADGVMTMNSTVAIDALTFGLPALVVGLPNNLTPFVDAGAMVGAGVSEDSIRDGLRALLYDQSLRRQLLDRAGVFLDRYGLRASGRAAGRAADAALAGMISRRRG